MAIGGGHFRTIGLDHLVSLTILALTIYQTPYRRRLSFQSLAARLILFLGRLDFRLKERFPVNRHGYASIVIAEKQL